MRKIALAFVLIALSFCAFAEGATKNYVLFVPQEYSVGKYDKPLQLWKNSLIKNIGYQADNITQAVFLKSDLVLIINNNVFHGLVYQNRLITNQFYIAEANIIIDFEQKKAGATGTHGISSHMTPSKRMVVVLAPRKNTSLLEAALDMASYKRVSKPIFESRKVAFQW